MIFWILLGLALILLPFIIWLTGSDAPEIGFSLFFVTIALLCGIFYISGTMFGLEKHNTYHKETTHSLTAVKATDKNHLSGTFFLGFGSVEGSSEKQYSYYYTKRDAAGRAYEQRANVPESMSRVYEDADGKPTVRHVVNRYEYSNPWLAPFPVKSSESERYDFTVPANSVQRTFELN
jgi:hypothetical protein